MNTPTSATPIPAPVRIVVTVRPTVVSALPPRDRRRRLLRREVTPTAEATIGNRWTAEFVGGPHHGERASGHHTPDEAVGALIRECANAYDTADDILDFFASLFGHHPHRSADVHLARSVRMAGKNPRRIHPGVRVEIQEFARELAPAAPQPAAKPGAPLPPFRPAIAAVRGGGL